MDISIDKQNCTNFKTSESISGCAKEVQSSRKYDVDIASVMWSLLEEKGHISDDRKWIQRMARDECPYNPIT